jgi:hypothetical protein
VVAGARPGRDSRPPPSFRADLVVSRADRYTPACWKRNSMLLRHMVRSTVASLRATATSAFVPPIRPDKARSQMEISDGRAERRSMTLAASS